MHGSRIQFFASCHCYERNFDCLNWLSTRTCGTGRPHVGLCHALLVTLDLVDARKWRQMSMSFDTDTIRFNPIMSIAICLIKDSFLHFTQFVWLSDAALCTLHALCDLLINCYLSAKAFFVSAPSVWNSLSYCWTSQYFQATFKDRTVWHCLQWTWTLRLAPPSHASHSLATYGTI